MAGRSVDFSELRDEIDLAVAAEIAVVGRERLNKEAIARRFADRGASRASICRWIDALMSGARPMPDVRARGAGSTEPAMAPGAAPVMSGMMSGPVVVAGASAQVSPAGGGIAVLQRLEECLTAVDQVMAYARREDGTVRNAKLLMGAAEQLRRTVDTVTRLRDSLRQDRDIDALHAAMVAEIEQESPDCAQRIRKRLMNLLVVNPYGA